MKTQKKPSREENKQGEKMHKHKLEETWALLVDSGKLVGILEKYFHPQKNW
jgi:hypothetical protein